MKKATLLIAFSALLIAHAAFANDIYVIDKNHSNVGFLIATFLPRFQGDLRNSLVKFVSTKPIQNNRQVEVTIRTASVNTDNDMRDKDLRSPNFFDVEKFPEMTFRSKSVKTTGQNTADVTGDLTMHGVTKEVVLKVEFTGKGKGPGPQGKTASGQDATTMVSGWDATTTLQRSDFGLTWNQMIEGTRVVGDEVQIELRVEADKQSNR